MRTDLTEPQDDVTGTKARLLAYLDYYRSVVVAKLTGLSGDDLRASRLPSGWSPLELLKHLVFMERRWMVWGFAGEQLTVHPWGDEHPHGRWHVDDDETLDDLVASLEEVAGRTRAIAEAADLDDRGSFGGRFSEGPAPTLEWILFHVLQEYARHAGHLDVARELVDGSIGENSEDDG
jgi:hypothetical protein